MPTKQLFHGQHNNLLSDSAPAQELVYGQLVKCVVACESNAQRLQSKLNRVTVFPNHARDLYSIDSGGACEQLTCDIAIKQEVLGQGRGSPVIADFFSDLADLFSFRDIGCLVGRAM